MNKRLREILILTVVLRMPNAFGDDLIHKIDQMKSTVTKAEASQRKIYNQIVSSSRQIKKMSDERAKVNEKVLDSEANSQELAFKVRELEEKIKLQRIKIGKSVSHIYRLKNPNLISFLFSEQSASEVEKNIRFLSVLSQKDYDSFLTFQKSLKEVRVAREKLKKEVKTLLALRENLKNKENSLLENQRGLSKVLHEVRSNKEKNLQLLKQLRSKLPELDQDTKVALFEKKGKLPSPVEGAVPDKTYGSHFDPTYRVKLLHLGWTYESLLAAPVKAVFQGKVVYVGAVPGFGQTVIIDHGDQYYSVYSHNRKNFVFEGEEVFPSQKIAESSSRLYFELRHFSNSIDPAKWISKDKTHQMAHNSVEVYEESQ